jgi:hypothetical protein
MVQKVFIAIPALCGVKDATTKSIETLDALGVGLHLHIRVGDSILPQARNVLLAMFLLCIDADIAWQPDAMARLLSHPVDFVAGAYRYKREPEEYPMQWLSKPELHADPATGLLEVAGVPFGFVRLSRSCCERMAEARKDYPFRVHDAPDLQCWCVFDLGYANGQYIGEDFVFCNRWRELGGKVWIDPELELTHVDVKGQGYTGSIGRWLKARPCGS